MTNDAPVQVVLDLPATKSFLRVWVEPLASESLRDCMDPDHVVRVCLREPVLDWCAEYLKDMPYIRPDTFPFDAEDPFLQIDEVIPNSRLHLYFSSEDDMIHFKLRWF